MKKRVAALLFIVGLASAHAQHLGPILGTNEQVHLGAALCRLNMTGTDLGFDKDMAKPVWTLDWVRKLLRAPLGLPVAGDRILAAVRTNDAERVWQLAADMLEAGPVVARGATARAPDLNWSGLDPELAGPLDAFAQAARRSSALLKDALAALSDEEQRYATASLLGGTFNVEDHPEIQAPLIRAGVTSQDVQRVIADGLAIDPEPSSTNLLAIMLKVKLADLLEAGRVLQQAAATLRMQAAAVQDWPMRPMAFPTEIGTVNVGSTGADAYASAALLILDPGGDDTYTGEAGQANGLAGHPLAAIVDLGGTDTYAGTGMLGPGSALFGVAVLLDAAGNDVYRAEYTGQAAALYGVAWLEDERGDDVYTAYAQAQAAASVGLAYLRDHGGNDIYSVGMSGQGCSGVRGLGLLVDAAGNDTYLAGVSETDTERNPERFLSLSQGFSIGMRPFAGGGVAALVDLAGNDTYVADVYGQGVSYWYSAAFLLDVSGNDTYRMHQYGQGSGIHLSLGLLADGGGNDMYTGYWLVQGQAHDYAVGMCFDQGGDDTYTADGCAQGEALNCSLGLLVDSSGDDAYFGRHPDSSQGIGSDGGRRECGSLALLLDLAGNDQYTCGATNGARLKRPLYGLVYDISTNQVDSTSRK